MKVTIELNNSTDSTIVFNTDGFGYEDILDSFKDSKEVTIITYSISEKMLKHLYDLDKGQKITIITNDPNRFMYNKSKSSASSQQDNLYSKIIDSSKFKADTCCYFCHSNHAKIIMTERIAYIGSHNYYSDSSIEAGVVIKDRKILSDLKTDIVDYLISISTPYKINRNYLKVDEITKHIKHIFRILEEVTSEANHDYYECGILHNSWMIDSTRILKVIEKLILIYGLLKSSSRLQYERKLFTHTVTKLIDSINTPEIVIIQKRIETDTILIIDALTELKTYFETESKMLPMFDLDLLDEIYDLLLELSCDIEYGIERQYQFDQSLL